MQLTHHAHTAYSTTSLEVLVLLKSKTLSHDREFTLVESGEQSPQRVHQGLPLPWCRWWNSSHGKLDKMMGNPAMHVCAQINQYWLVLRISDIWVSQFIIQTARGQGAESTQHTVLKRAFGEIHPNKYVPFMTQDWKSVWSEPFFSFWTAQDAGIIEISMLFGLLL